MWEGAETCLLPEDNNYISETGVIWVGYVEAINETG